MPPATPTQSEILRFLREKSQYFVSGADLAERFGISRTGVWKHVQKLKTLGYDILSHPKQGYKLIEVPDSLAAEEIGPNLRTRWLGRAYHYLEITGSTNDHALLLAAQGAPHGTVVVAEQQTSGRGRLRREWFSLPNRGIYMSVLIRTPLPVRIAPLSTNVAALALAKLLSEDYGLPSTLKWPNDVLIAGRKVAGLLTEMQSDQDFSRFLVVGIGINVNHNRKEMTGPFRYPPTSVAIETGAPLKRQHLLLAYLRRLEKEFEEFFENGFTQMVPEVERFSLILGKQITVLCGDREIGGVARGFTPEGALLLLGNDGTLETVWAGDVTRVEGAV